MKFINMLALMAALVLSAGHASADTAARQAAAENLADSIGLAEASRTTHRDGVAELLGRIQQQSPNVPGKAFDILEQEYDAVEDDVVTAMVAATVALYVESFTAAEMDAIAAFYRTPAGMKALREMPALSREGAAAGQAIGERLGAVAAQRAMSRIRAEGLMP